MSLRAPRTGFRILHPADTSEGRPRLVSAPENVTPHKNRHAGCSGAAVSIGRRCRLRLAFTLVMVVAAPILCWRLGVLQATAQPEPAGEHAQPSAGAEEHAGAEQHAEPASPWELGARVANFAILAGVLVYFLRSPLNKYLGDRREQVRRDLESAVETRKVATEQLVEIDRRLAALPGELEALRARGVQEIADEETRIRQAAEAERERLLEQTRREIDLQLRAAKRELLEEAAELAVGSASDRIKRDITDADQLKLVDRYLGQVGTRQP